MKIDTQYVNTVGYTCGFIIYKNKYDENKGRMIYTHKQNLVTWPVILCRVSNKHKILGLNQWTVTTDVDVLIGSQT